MKLSKIVTHAKTITVDGFFIQGVTGVTEGVTDKTIDIDTLYYIVTPVTRKSQHPRMGELLNSHIFSSYNTRVFRGNRGNGVTNVLALRYFCYPAQPCYPQNEVTT